jgi:VWFA-related protein
MTTPVPKASRGRQFLLGTVLMLMNGMSVLPQDSVQKGKSTFSVKVEIVNVFVTVRDKLGGLVRDLTQEDFTLSEDGRKQTISFFSKEIDLPLTIGLIVDTSPSEAKMMPELQAASRVFLKKMIQQGKDNTFLMQFGETGMTDGQYEGKVELLQDLTSSPALIDEGIGQLGHMNSMAGKPSLRRRSADTGMGADFNTMLADSVYMASDEILKPVQGRKALIVLGDGFHVGNRMEMAVAAAQEADALIYTIRIYDSSGAGPGGFGGGRSMFGGPPGFGGGRGMFGGPPGFGGGPGGSSIGSPDEWAENLKALSKKTGGAYFEAGSRTLVQIFAQIEEELRSQYSLGYTPGKNQNSGYRKIKVEVPKKMLVVNGREGYYPPQK